MTGKFKHVDDVAQLEGKARQDKANPEYQKRMAKYKAFIQPSPPTNK
jgi:hypothetical protein